MNWLGLVYGFNAPFIFTFISTIFQLFRGGQFYLKRKPEYLEKIALKTTYLLSQEFVLVTNCNSFVNDKLTYC
jgi:hypothetical protein